LYQKEFCSKIVSFFFEGPWYRRKSQFCEAEREQTQLDFKIAPIQLLEEIEALFFGGPKSLLSLPF